MGFGQDLQQVARGWRWTRRPLVPASVEREREPAKDFPTAWGRTPAGRAAREVVQRLGLAPLLHFEVDVEVCGQEVLDTIEPPAIFVLNHSSHLDAPTVLTSLPTKWRRKAVVGAASDYFFDTWYRSIATTVVFNAFPIARTGGLRSARMARQLISEGWSLVLFPEGSRTPDGWVGEFRTGAAWLALENDVPVVPVALIGAYQAMPRGRSWPKPGRPPVRIRFGLPIRAVEEERAAAFSDRLRQGLGKVMEEDQSTWWNAIRLDAAGELFDPGGPQVATWRRMWETSRPIRPSRARSVWSPDTHEWEAEHLWSGTGWQDGTGLELPPPPTVAEPEPAAEHEPAPEPEPLPAPAPAPDPAPGPAPGGATEAVLFRVEEFLAQAIQPEGPDANGPPQRLGAEDAQTRDLRPPSGTPAEPTPGELARIESVLDEAFPRPQEPEEGDGGDDTFFDVDMEAPPPPPDRPGPERGWFLRRPRRGQPPPR